MKRPTDVSRRGFLTAGAAAVAAAALPLPAIAAKPSRAALLEPIRAWYAAEIERLGSVLRPRFEAGELYAFRDSDPDHQKDRGHYRIENAVREHFGLSVTEREDEEGRCWAEGDEEQAFLIMLASPHALMVTPNADHPASDATEAAGWDLIVMARERGWYTPTSDECGDPAA